jgi:hypothetical protein
MKKKQHKTREEIFCQPPPQKYNMHTFVY